jgi:Putative adhesin
VPGEIRLDRGSLSVQNVIGPVKLTTHSTDVTLDGFTEGLDLNVDRGDIELRPERLPLGKISVHARSGNIELALPQSAKFALNASTDHGEVDNQFGEALKESSKGRGAKLEGSIGAGPDVSLVTQHGRITVRRASGENAPAKAVGDEQRGFKRLAPVV